MNEVKNDEDVMDRLKKANDLIEIYKDLLRPVLGYLADKKSREVFGKPDCYDGNFGCYDTGITDLCLHIKDEYRYPYEEEKAYRSRIEDFEEKWRQQLMKLKIIHLYISGHY